MHLGKNLKQLIISNGKSLKVSSEQLGISAKLLNSYFENECLDPEVFNHAVITLELYNISEIKFSVSIEFLEMHRAVMIREQTQSEFIKALQQKTESVFNFQKNEIENLNAVIQNLNKKLLYKVDECMVLEKENARLKKNKPSLFRQLLKKAGLNWHSKTFDQNLPV